MKNFHFYSKCVLVILVSALQLTPLFALDYYWVGGSGLWSDHNNHWATTSGGNVFHDQVPTSMDNVYFDANSLSPGDSVTIDSTIIYCRNLILAGVENTSLSGSENKQLWIYGSLTLNSEMRLAMRGVVHFRSTQASQTIFSAGQSFIGPVVFDGFDGEWTFLDAFTVNGSVSFSGVGSEWAFLDAFTVNGSVDHNDGILRTNGNEVRVEEFFSSGGEALYLYNSIIHARHFDAYPGLLDAGTSHVFADYLQSPGYTFYNVTGRRVTDCNITGKLTFPVDGNYSSNFGSTVNEAEFLQDGGINLYSTQPSSFNEVTFWGNGNIGSSSTQPSFFNNATFFAGGSISGNNDFMDLNLAPGSLYGLHQTTTILPGGSLNASGADCGNYITLTSGDINSPAYLNTSGENLTLQYVTAMGISVTGGGIITAQNSVDLGGNSGWNFSPLASRDLYWVGGGGNWSDIAHWSLSSGGPGGECIPSPFDNVFFDANSFSTFDSVRIDNDIAYCHDMNWQGVQNTPIFTTVDPDRPSSFIIYGSLFLSPEMSFNLNVNFHSTQPGQTISLAGQSINGSVAFSGVEGEWAFLDAFTANGSVSFSGVGSEWAFLDAFTVNGSVDHNDGILRTNGNEVRVEEFFSSGGEALYLYNSIIHARHFDAYPGLLDAGTSHVFADYLQSPGYTFYNVTGRRVTDCNITGKLTFPVDGNYSSNLGSTVNEAEFLQDGGINLYSTQPSSFNEVTFWGNGNIGSSSTQPSFFNNATFFAGGSISGNNDFMDLNLAPGSLYGLHQTTTILPGGSLNASGADCGNYITLTSGDINSPAYLNTSGENLTLQYVTAMGISVTGGGIITAQNSVDLGGNSGWNFSPLASRDLYWVGGGGNWSDIAHWSLSSGGPGGECIPSPFDNVFFDANSFSTFDSVRIDNDIAYCHDMNWQGVQNTPIFTTVDPDRPSSFIIYGSLFLSPEMSFNLNVNFHSTQPGQTISLAGQSINGSVAFSGVEGEWAFLDAFTANGSVSFSGVGSEWAFLDAFTVNGSVDHNDGILRTNGNEVRVEEFFSSGGEALYLYNSIIHARHFDAYPGLLDAGTSHVFADYLQSPGYTFYNVTGRRVTDCNITGKLTFPVDGNYSSNLGSTVNEAEFQQDGRISLNSTQPSSFNEVTFWGNGNIGSSSTQPSSFKAATFFGNGSISGDNEFGQITFSPGRTYILASFSTQTITPLGNFIAEGDGSFPIELRSSSLGMEATLHKDGDPICLDFLYMTDIAATGTSFEYAGANSDDVFGNSGWLFEACPSCFDAAPSSAPTLDPTSVIAVLAGQQVTLILQDVPPDHEVLWFDAYQTKELYANTANFFQRTVSQDTTFYGAYRDLATGCVSDLLPVMVCVVDTPTPGVGDLDGDGIPDPCDPILDVNGAVATLKDYIEDANINDRIANAIIQRLCLAEMKFCDYGYVSSVLSTLDNLVSYISYQSGRGIPTADADYLITQIEALSTAIANGNAECTNAASSSARLSGNTWDTDHSALLQIFPNPAQGQLSLTQKEYTGKQATVMITNNLGVLLRRTAIEEMPAEALTLDLSGLPGGHYFLTLEVEGGTAVTKRFVIAR